MHSLTARYEIQRWRGGTTVWKYEILRWGVVVKTIQTHDITVSWKIERYLAKANIERIYGLGEQI
ncbi:hypothetical protein [Rhizobium sp. BE258]|uniref:hypothetical protein n=1 Tax=Rhizobium sp. BE258 TaxID=2817722 RepID=UPI0028647D4B|nr:hypothetical protein [Rhizobium sp. BE258]MDR7147067.1 hypothetical protein [Rhizobium sp. BE258]